MRHRIVIANRVHQPVLDLLSSVGDVVMNEGLDPWSNAELRDRCRDADALMAFMTERIDAAFLDGCPSLKIVAGALKGYNNLDVDACSERGILVTICPDLLTEPTAELAIGLMIAVARNILPGDAYVRSGTFNGWRPRFYGGSIDGATITVIGAGAVGQTILRMLKGFNCRKQYVDTRPLDATRERDLSAERVSLDTALERSDFVVLGVHLMADTEHLANAAFISRMKPGAYLINPARGSLVDEAAVARALADGALAGYAADTFELEDWALDGRPREVHAALLASEKTVFTPHIGSGVRHVRQAIELSAAESIQAVLSGNIPATAVNAAKAA